MLKFASALTLLTLLLTFANAGIILPPDCDSGAGVGLDATVTVTNLLGLQPYTLTSSGSYNVSYSFFPTARTVGVSVFTVTAEFSVDGVVTSIPVATAPVPNLMPVLYLGYECIDRVTISLLSALNLISPFVAQLQFVVPNIANATALFRGEVTGTTLDLSGANTTTSFVCKQGLVNIVA